MNDLDASSRGTMEPEAGWFDLFSKRYWKGKISEWKLDILEHGGNWK